MNHPDWISPELARKTLEITSATHGFRNRGLQTGKEAYQWREGFDVFMDMFPQDCALANDMTMDVWYQFRKMYRECVTVLWLDDLRKAAVKGAEHFIGRSVHGDKLNPPKQFWVFSHDLNIPEEARDGINAVLRVPIPDYFDPTGMLVIGHPEYPDNCVVIQVWDKGPEAPEWSQGEWQDVMRFGRIGPQWCPRFVPLILAGTNQATDRNRCAIAAMIGFLGLELTELVRERLPRSDRRRRQKSGNDDPDPDIRMVALRRRHLEYSGITPSPDQVDWSCRWVVSGHWRQQWYPSTQENRPIFISPYVKGPDDKPLKTDTAEKVFVVRQ